MGGNAQAVTASVTNQQPYGAVEPYDAKSQQVDVDFIDWIALLVAFIVLASSNYWKVIGSGPLLAFGVFCVIYLFIAKVKGEALLPSAWLGSITGIGVVYLLLSYFEMLPDGAVMFDQQYVLRMGYFVIIIYPISAFYYQILRKMYLFDNYQVSSWMALAISLITPLALFAYPPVDGHWIIEGQDIGFVQSFYSNLNYTITNLNILFVFSILHLSARNNGLVLVFTIFAVTSESAQMLFVAVLTVLIWVSPKRVSLVKPIAYLIVVGFPLMALAMVRFADSVGIDPNTIHRARWWSEAIMACFATGGIGLGFGADSTTDYIVDERFEMTGKWGQLPVHVIHNDIVYSFYSMGIIGGLLISSYILYHLMPRDNEQNPLGRPAAILYLMLCLTLSVNSGLVSPAIFVGVCMLFGYLEVYRRCSPA